MAKLTVDVVTPERRILQAQADEAVIPGATGFFGVRPGHTAYLSLVDAGLLTLKDGATTQSYFVAGGFAEVLNDKVTVLADQAEPAASIDVTAATQRLRAAQERLQGLKPADPAYEAAAATVRQETARVAAAGKRA